MSQINSLKGSAKKKVLSPTLLNTIPKSPLKGSAKKKVLSPTLLNSMQKSPLKNTKHDESAEMLEDILELKSYSYRVALNNKDVNTLRIGPDVKTDPYCTYLLQFYISNKIDYYSIPNDLKNYYNKINKLFTDNLKVLKNKNNTSLCELEDFKRFDDIDTLNRVVAENILLNEDRLLKYFKIAYDKKYINCLIKLEFFADYLIYLTVCVNDFDLFKKIKELYLNVDDKDQIELFKIAEKFLKVSNKKQYNKKVSPIYSPNLPDGVKRNSPKKFRLINSWNK
jgi:hypothetical protein